MIKLFFTCIIILAFGILGYVLVSLLKNYTKKYTIQSDNNSPQNIDSMIENIKTKIKTAQFQVAGGMYKAEEDLKKYKEDLKKLENLKSKIK